MSLQDRLGSANALQLISIGAGLSIMTVGGTFGYNFPLLLFGVVAHEMHSSIEPLRIFTSFTAFTFIFDILAFLGGAGFVGIGGIFAFFILLIKVPIFMTCSNILKERGGELRWGVPSMQSFQQGFQGLGRGDGIGGGPQPGTTSGNWNMPGGFTSGNTGTPVGSGGPRVQNTAPPPAANFPKTGGFRLGGEDEDENPSAQGGAPPAPAPGRNGYSSIA